jgi:UDP-glucose 4-epimerase
MLAGVSAVINGDGIQTRDYVFVGDVVRANVLALDHKGSNVFNIGTEKESDVNTLFRILKEKTGSSCEEKHGPAKKGEQMRSVLNHGKITSALGWKPTVTLEEGLARTVEYFKHEPTHGV